ncbi:hypothetical protein RUM43_007544 [Polyplax serrata]|uniref:Uncharacterized protein n=1 Tax=Polyplax serrata TaxID=468196 RepID=A0AAN8S7Y1_POLSC
MISFWAGRDQNCLTLKSPLAFFVNLFKKKKYKVRSNVKDSIHTDKSEKVPTVLSVSVMDIRMSSPSPLSPAHSVLTLTPGRTRDIDQDMEALRLSRQDNPFLQVLASRESLVESLFESESDDMNLMSQEFQNELDVDPMSLPEIHEHMIRSPPPTTWPKSPNYKIFRFPAPGSEESLDVNGDQPGNNQKTLLQGTSSSLLDSGDISQRNIKLTEKTTNYCNSNFHTITVDCPKNNVESPYKRLNSECKDNNLLPVFRPTPIRSHSDIHCPQSHDVNPKSDTADRKFDGTVPLTQHLLLNRFS